MGFKRYNYSFFVLIILVVICATFMGGAFFSSRIHLAILFLVLVGVEAGLLYQIFVRTNREVLFFFKALENDDTSLNYSSSHRNRLINELHQYLNKLNTSFREMKVSQELREQYFSRILENLSSGLMVISKTGHINHINNEALRLFNVPHLTHMKALAEVDQNLYSTVKGLKSSSKMEQSLPDSVTGIKKVLGLQCIEINLKGEDVRIVTIQDLSVEMERKEIDDWIRLIRIMSHEIMNSLAPITSISNTLKEVWAEDMRDQNHADPAILQTVKGLDAIAEQSEGLTTFFESYRVLSRIPDPVMSNFLVCSMFEKLETLSVHNEENAGIDINFMCSDPKLQLQADEQMITQVMLNLIKNAAQALESAKEPAIYVQANLDRKGGVVLKVTDNGPGIPIHIVDEIFLPFFTTRKKGTGVGLSYSRQVMSMNNGTIDLDSAPGRTEFRLLF